MIKSAYKPKMKHTWVKAEQPDSMGRIIKLFVCTSCTQPHKKAYDLVDGIANEEKLD